MDKIEYGFRNVYYSVITESAGTITYGTPKSFLAQGCGGISVNLAPVGDETEFHADDITWFENITNNGYDGDLVMTNVSDDFKKDVMMFEEDSNGALIEKANVIFNKFALGFEVQGNENPTRTWYYYCSVSRPNDEHNTKETSITPAQKTLSLKARPRPTDEKVKVSLKKATTSTSVYNSFFNNVYDASQPTL